MFGLLVEISVKIIEHKLEQSATVKPKNIYEFYSMFDDSTDEATEFIENNFDLAFNTRTLYEDSDNSKELSKLLEEYLSGRLIEQ